MECKGINFVKYTASPEREKQSASYKTLDGAVVLVPEGTVLSETALTTIRHFRYYQNGCNATLLISDSAGMMLDADALDQMIEYARKEARNVCGSMPDFATYSMNDGGSLVLMQECTVGFRPYAFSGSASFPVEAPDVCKDIRDACRQFRILAVVYNNGADFEKYNS